MRHVAAFDFDGTIMRGDAVLPFCAMAGGRLRAVRVLARHAPKLLAVARGTGDRDVAKKAVVHGCLANLSLAHVDASALAFSGRVVPSRLFSEAVKRIEWHREQGHEVVIVSASLEVYLRPIAAMLKVDHVLGTRLARSGDHLTGELDGPNVRAEQKAVRLREFLGGESAELWAYGNSADDDAMLAMAQHPVRVDKHGVFSPAVATSEH